MDNLKHYKKIIFICIFLVVSYYSSKTQWIECNGPNSEGVILSLSYFDNYLYAGTHKGGILRSKLENFYWENVSNNLPEKFVQSITRTQNYIFIGTKQSGIFRSSNNGNFWSTSNNGITNYDITELIQSNNKIIASTFGSGVFISSDNGNSWVARNSNLIQPVNTIFALGDTLFAGTNGNGIYISENMGLSWRKSENALFKSVYSIAYHKNIVFIGTENGIFYSDDLGYSWIHSQKGLYGSLKIQALVSDGKNLFVGTKGNGVFFSTNNGQEWFESGLNNKNVTKLIVINNEIYAGTDLYGVFKSKISDLLPKDNSITFNLNKTSFCQNETLILNFQANGLFLPNNSFVAEISNEFGSFDNSIAIGSTKSISSGSIVCKIPKEIKPGTNYKIRIYSTQPQVFSKDNNQIITINESPKPLIAGIAEVCENSYESYVSNPFAGEVFWDVVGGKIIGNNNYLNVTINWGKSGNGKIILIHITKDGCKDSTELNVQINKLPQPQIIGNDTTAIGSIEKYRAKSNGLKYEWLVLNGNILSPNNLDSVIVLWNEKGVGKIKLTEYNKNCINSFEKNVFVNDRLEISGNSVTCEDQVETYSFVADPKKTYSWLFSRATIIDFSNINIIKVKWTSSGVDTIKVLINENNGRKDTIIKIINILPKPKVKFLFSNSFCINDTLVELLTEPPGGQFEGSGIIGNKLIPANSKIGSHKINFKYLGSNGCQLDTSIMININPVPPKPTIKREGNILKSSSTIGNQWFLNGKPIEGANDSVLIVSLSGKYALQVKINGCYSEISDEVEINLQDNNNLIVDFDIDKTEGELPLLVKFTNKSSQEFKEFLFEFGDGNSSEERDPQHIYHNPGIYTVTLTATNNQVQKKIEKKNLIKVYDKSEPNEFQIELIGEKHRSVELGEKLVIELKSKTPIPQNAKLEIIYPKEDYFVEDEIITSQYGIYYPKLSQKIKIELLKLISENPSSQVYIVTKLDNRSIDTITISVQHHGLKIGQKKYDILLNKNKIRGIITPNPSNGQLELQIISEIDVTTQLIITNAFSELVLTEHLSLIKGVNKFHFNLSNLSSGFYQMMIFNFEEIIYLNLIILK